MKIPPIGEKIGRLTVLKHFQIEGKGRTLALCKCDCGRIKAFLGYNLELGNTVSCGCLNREHINQKFGQKKTHGHCSGIFKDGSRTYKAWISMRQRCRQPKNNRFEHYGARGIGICERWDKFENFLEDMGERPPGKSLDRKDNDKGYSKDNCRWATPLEQSRNRQKTVKLTFCGETKPVGDWADEFGIARDTLVARLRRGWDAERALTGKLCY